MDSAIRDSATSRDDAVASILHDDDLTYVHTGHLVSRVMATELKDMKSVGTKFLEDCRNTDRSGQLSQPLSSLTILERGPPEDNRHGNRSLHLLDLPVDILKDVVKEV